MRIFLLALATAASLALTACGSDDQTVVVPPGGTAVIEDGNAKVCPAGQTC